MTHVSGARPRDAGRHGRALYRRVFAINGLVFTTGVLALALSPATVSWPVLPHEVIVLVVGLVVILAANAVLLRVSLAPLDELVAVMQRVDPLRNDERLDETGNGDLATLIGEFNEMLDRIDAERAEASSFVLTAQEQERQRIARELHDEIGQSLTVALLVLRRTSDRAPADLRDDLHLAQETIRAGLDEVRGIARRLRPDVLDDLGLRSALKALCNDFADAGSSDVVRDIDPDLPALAPAAELVCYRVAQEALTNAARHAHASAVELTLRAVDDRIELRVADNGRGSGGREGAGITGMRERALLIGAVLTVSSTPGQGTTVELRIPAGRARP